VLKAPSTLGATPSCKIWPFDPNHLSKGTFRTRVNHTTSQADKCRGGSKQNNMKSVRYRTESGFDYSATQTKRTCRPRPSGFPRSEHPLPPSKPRSSPDWSGPAVSVLVQPEMEKRRSPLVSIPPFGRGLSRHGVFRSDGGWAAQERALTPPFIVSMSPPGYPSAWLRPRSARFRFARQNHCNSATSCRFSTSGLPVTLPEPRPARPES
jgi:hypothetical protein